MTPKRKTNNQQQNCILSQNINNPTKLYVFQPGFGLKYVFGIYHIFCMLLQDSDAKMMKNQAKNKHICCYPVEGLDLLNLGYYLFMILLLFWWFWLIGDKYCFSSPFSLFVTKCSYRISSYQGKVSLFPCDKRVRIEAIEQMFLDFLYLKSVFSPAFLGSRPAFLCGPGFRNKPKNGFFASFFFNFASKSCISMWIMWKIRFQPVYWVCSTQTLIETYNTTNKTR